MTKMKIIATICFITALASTGYGQTRGQAQASIASVAAPQTATPGAYPMPDDAALKRLAEYQATNTHLPTGLLASSPGAASVSPVPPSSPSMDLPRGAPF